LLSSVALAQEVRGSMSAKLGDHQEWPALRHDLFSLASKH
jgi:hypothetical protein